MKKIVFALASILFIHTASFGQDKVLSMQEAIGGYHLYPRGVNQLQWAGDQHYAYVDTDTKDGESALKRVDAGLNEDFWITRGEIETALLAIDADSLSALPRVRWTDKNSFRFYHKGTYYSYNTEDKKATKLFEYSPATMSHADVNWSTNAVAYVNEDNLYVNGDALTTDGGNGIVYGQAVHRSEFGITNGTFWSESGKKLAFYRMDESMVTAYPLYNLDQKPANSKEIRYPVVGDPSHHVTIGVYDVSSKKVIYLKTGEPKEQYLTNVSWGPNDKYIYVAVVNRGQDHMWLKQFDASTGEFVKTLFEEIHDKYVEPEHGLTFIPGNDNEFIWWSERDGFTHLYLYNTEGELIRQLTEGPFEVIDFHGFSADMKSFFVTTTKESAINRDLYSVSFKKAKKMKRLTENEGTHSITTSSDNSYFIDNFSSTITPREVRIISAKSGLLETLKKVENPLSEYKLGQMTISTISANDGTPLYYRLFKPTDFDPNKKYPVVVYLYNGPHAQMIRNTWLGGANMWFQYMAQHGYVVFTVDGRGSANRGFEFESAIHRQLGTLEMEDQLAGVQFLKSLSYVDSTRMGIHGWSYGGFMTTSMMTRKPGTFQVGVAGGPVIDWIYYEIMYTERYMDSPDENPEGYKNNNLLNYVDNLEGRLLMIHGGQDDVVLWQHSLMYMQKNIESGNSNLDYFVYPHHPHNVGGKDRIHLYQKVTDYFDLYLKP